jgi:hypothetical protein
MVAVVVLFPATDSNENALIRDLKREQIQIIDISEINR